MPLPPTASTNIKRIYAPHCLCATTVHHLPFATPTRLSPATAPLTLPSLITFCHIYLFTRTEPPPHCICPAICPLETCPMMPIGTAQFF